MNERKLTAKRRARIAKKRRKIKKARLAEEKLWTVVHREARRATEIEGNENE